MLKELKWIQSDVNRCHESQDGKVLLQQKSAAELQMDQSLAQYLKDRQSERSDERLARKEANTRKRPVFNYAVVSDDDAEHSAPDDEENASDAEYNASDDEVNASDDEYIDAEQPNEDDHIDPFQVKRSRPGPRSDLAPSLAAFTVPASYLTCIKHHPPLDTSTHFLFFFPPMPPAFLASTTCALPFLNPPQMPASGS